MRTSIELIKQQDRILKFLAKHPDYFDEWEKMHIRSGSKIDYSGKFIPDIMRELFAELDLFKEDEDIYQGFLDLLKQEFDINQDIVEIGGGIIPNLAKRIAMAQEKGTVTVYDPRLGTTKTDIPNLKLRKEKFTLSTDISKAGLVVAFMPCEATETIIRSATSNKKDFMLGFCEGGPHGDIFDFYESDDEWLHAMLYYAENQIESNNLGTLQKTYFKKYHDPYPIVWNKRD